MSSASITILKLDAGGSQLAHVVGGGRRGGDDAGWTRSRRASRACRRRGRRRRHRRPTGRRRGTTSARACDATGGCRPAAGHEVVDEPRRLVRRRCHCREVDACRGARPRTCHRRRSPSAPWVCPELGDAAVDDGDVARRAPWRHVVPRITRSNAHGAATWVPDIGLAVAARRRRWIVGSSNAR